MDFVKNLISSDLELERTLLLDLCDLVDSPRSIGIRLIAETNSWSEYVKLEINPEHYDSSSKFADDYLVTTVLKKSPNLPINIDRRASAIDSFFISESHCKTINSSIEDIASDPRFRRVKAECYKMLGKVKRPDLNYVSDNMRFGPGASTSVKGFGSVKSDKYDGEIHLTIGLLPFYKTIMGNRWRESVTEYSIVEGSNFTTVPKSAKTDRGICIEPSLNTYVQLGIGKLLRSRLKQHGLDLNTQDVNRAYAQRAYEDRLATIDLSMASDTISERLVFKLLPWDWYNLLAIARCESTKIDDTYHKLEKFSSMGNGYTFELESLIFLAVCRSIVPIEEHDDVVVFGDDIIVPQEYAIEVVECLELLGFKTNREKSFLAGSFFESCGSDWFHSQPVRPFYCKGAKKGIPYPLQLCNSLRHYAKRRAPFGCDPRFRPLWLRLRKKVHRLWRLPVPESLGDSGLLDSKPDYCSPASNGREGWLTSHIVLVPRKIRKHSFGRLLCGLACGSPDVFSQGFEPRRGYLGLPSKKKVLVSTWTDSFDWYDKY